MQLPALIYQTKRLMDDYQADDMHHGDLDILALRNRFHLNVDDVSRKVNPRTLEQKEPLNKYPFLSHYERLSLSDEPVKQVSKAEGAVLMFDEFRELAKEFSFQGAYQHIITEMITYMQENSGKPYSSPLLDKALKAAINFEYGFIPLEYKKEFQKRVNDDTVLPKFDRLVDRTNGLVITVHDAWSTHITSEPL